MYGLCRQTVTLFRGGEEITLTGCYLEEKLVQKRDVHGTYRKREFLLIVPGDRPIYPGDKVCTDGEKMTVRSVIPYFSDGKICHREGRGA